MKKIFSPLPNHVTLFLHTCACTYTLIHISLKVTDWQMAVSAMVSQDETWGEPDSMCVCVHFLFLYFGEDLNVHPKCPLTYGYLCHRGYKNWGSWEITSHYISAFGFFFFVFWAQHPHSTFSLIHSFLYWLYRFLPSMGFVKLDGNEPVDKELLKVERMFVQMIWKTFKVGL